MLLVLRIGMIQTYLAYHLFNALRCLEMALSTLTRVQSIFDPTSPIRRPVPECCLRKMICIFQRGESVPCVGTKAEAHCEIEGGLHRRQLKCRSVLVESMVGGYQTRGN